MRCSIRTLRPGLSISPISLAFVAVVSTASAFGLLSAPPAEAASGPAARVSVQVSAPRQEQATKIPNSNIELKDKTRIFSPHWLKTTWSGSAEKKCTTAKQVVTISNLTKKTQTVTYEGQLLVKLPAGYQFGTCFWGTGVGRFVFGVGRSSAQLTVSVR